MAHKNGTTNFFLFGCMLLAAFALLPLVAALPSSPTEVDIGPSTRREITPVVTPVDAVAGNVTQIDLYAIAVTQSWQGYYGNVTGSFILANADNETFYQWANDTSVQGEVFASRNSSIDWDTINCSTPEIITEEQLALGQSVTDSDSVNVTFNETNHPSFIIGSRNMTGCPSTNTWSNGTQSASAYYQVFLADDANKTVYSTIISSGSLGFDNQYHDFQLMVGENEHPGFTGPTSYYFFVELG